MRSRIAECHQGIKLHEPLLRLLALYGLRLVNNENRVRLGNDVNRSAAAKLIQLHINPASIFASGIERLGIDDHHIDGTVRGESVNLCKLR